MYVDPGINTSASNLKWVLPYCKPDLPRVVGALLLFIANNTMALTIPILSGIIVDRVIVGGHADELPRLCGLMILMTIIRVGARYGYQMWMERFGRTRSTASSPTNTRSCTSSTSRISTTHAPATS